jgi:hypothetical protein
VTSPAFIPGMQLFSAEDHSKLHQLVLPDEIFDCPDADPPESLPATIGAG